MKNTTLFYFTAVATLYTAGISAATSTTTRANTNSSNAVSMVIEQSWWKPSLYNYEIGYESGTTSTGVLGQNVLTGGTWLSDTFGLDFYLGYTKAANTLLENVAESTNVLSTPNTKSVTTSYAGENFAHNITFGTGLKYRMVQTDWYQFNIGLLFAFYTPNSSEHKTGSKTETYADATKTGDKTVTESTFGTVKTETSLQMAVGPRIGTEFYLKWIPHLGIGFAGGILTTLFGNVTQTTDAHTRTYAVTGGTEGTPTTDSLKHNVQTNSPGLRGTTFGVGGTTFSLLGVFSVRYIW